MSVLSDLTLEINNTLPTGVDHQITAAKVRQVLTDMASQILASQAVVSGGGGGGVAERYLTTGTTANPGDVCYCNTSTGGFTITLPSNPVAGTGVGFRDAESTWAASNLTVFPGSNNIENQSGNLVCDVTNGNFDLVWSGTAAGWQLIPAISFAGSGTGGGTGGGAGAAYYHINSNQPVVAGGIYYCDTSAGAFTVTLPTGPAIGTGISFLDPVGGWGVSNLILNPGANPINSNAGNFVVDQPDINFDLVWRGQPIGWQVEVPVSDAVRGTGGLERLRAIQTLGVLGQVATATGGAGAITFNPSDKATNVALSSGNLTATLSSGAGAGVRATTPGVAGRYFEITWSVAATTGGGFGLATSGQSLTAYPGDPNAVGFFASGYVEWPGSGTGNTTGITWGTGDVMGILLGASSCTLFKNGTSAYTVNTLPSGALYPILFLGNASDAATANFGATTLAHRPTGAVAWNGTQGTTTTATWNPSDQSGLVLSNGNLTATGTSGGGQGRGTKAGASGKYFEVHIDASTSGAVYVGLANASQSLSPSSFAGNPNGISYWNNGYAEWPGGSGTGSAYSTGAVIGIRLLGSTAEFYQNGLLQFTTGGIPAGSIYPIVGLYNASSAVTANFGATTFASTPSGAVAWNT